MAHKPYKSKELDAIRQKIDELDTRIHDTLKERAEPCSPNWRRKKKKQY